MPVLNKIDFVLGVFELLKLQLLKNEKKKIVQNRSKHFPT